MAERIQIYIDGGNFYHLVLKKLKIQESDFNFDQFVRFLAGERLFSNGGKRYYTGTVREQMDDPKSKESMSRQTQLFTSLKKSGWEIKTSKLRKRLEEVTVDRRMIGHEKLLSLGLKKIQFERWREKGIDVKIATDLIAGAVDNKYDTAIVVSSDGDLVPAIDWVRKRCGKRVEYVGFSILDSTDTDRSTKPLLTMISRTDRQRVITEEEIKAFVAGATSLFAEVA